MAWAYYRLKFRLLGPLHIGYRKIGNLMQTRSYVPGKNIWAALTARLTRDADKKDYIDIGEKVQNNFRFGYLWPSIDGNKPCFFWKYDDFDYLFLDSYTSTALDYDAKAAHEGSLHETEFIAPIARNGTPVYLLGDLWVNEGQRDLAKWQEAMGNIQIGGERAYGWGRLACSSDWSSVQYGCERTIAGHEWQELSGNVILTLNRDDRITAHALAYGSGANACLVGSVEPLVGREWHDFAGQNTTFEQVYFAPGSRIDQKTEKTRFKIVENGRWSSPEVNALLD